LPTPLVRVGASSTSAVGPARTREIETALIELLSLPDDLRPTAIIDPWDSDMEACYFALTSLGVRVPEEMSLVSFGGASRLTTLTKRLTAVTVDEPKTAELTAQLLDEMRTGERPIADASSFAVPLSFHQGETVSVPPALPPRWKPN
jgi:GntR family transcriptional regulator, arabinose operon transcriptional repressor